MPTSDIKTQILLHTPAKTPGTTQNIAETLASRYEILDSLGEGGMGMVYRVRDRETTEVLALKLLRPEIARDPAMMERFKNEIRLAHHPLGHRCQRQHPLQLHPQFALRRGESRFDGKDLLQAGRCGERHELLRHRDGRCSGDGGRIQRGQQ